MQPTKTGRIRGKLTPVGTIAALVTLALVFCAPATAWSIDESEYEYEYYEGLHEEEWYDPSDWFDDPSEDISYETDWYDYTYGYDWYDGALY